VRSHRPAVVQVGDVSVIGRRECTPHPPANISRRSRPTA